MKKDMTTSREKLFSKKIGEDSIIENESMDGEKQKKLEDSMTQSDLEKSMQKIDKKERRGNKKKN
jgi:hypothetical protein